MGEAVSRGAAALLLEASNEGAAARRLAVQMGATLTSPPEVHLSPHMGCADMWDRGK